MATAWLVSPGARPLMLHILWWYTLAIGIGLLWPALAIPPVMKRPDLIVHAIVFGLLTLLACLADPARVRHGWRAAGVAGVAGGVMGGLTEWLQTIPVLKRTGAIDDWLANLLGVACGLLLYGFILLLSRRGVADITCDQPAGSAGR